MRTKSLGKIAIVLGIILMPVFFLIIFKQGKNNYKHLEIFGPKEIGVSGDTTYFTVPDFHLVNQNGETITQKNLDGKIYVANFFFASCPGICPKMTDELKRVQDEFINDTDVLFISHTVDPEHDSLPALIAFAKNHGADLSKWFFVTGNRDSIYDLAIKGYLVPAAEDARAEGGYLHSQDLLLIDKEKRIRGIYDSLEPEEINRLKDEIKVLLYEYKEEK
ncbi:MAG TPA: SCO family protein [Bacteroidia bacterium]|nr:SCO family protein [Bacteroidia bacterium]